MKSKTALAAANKAIFLTKKLAANSYRTENAIAALQHLSAALTTHM